MLVKTTDCNISNISEFHTGDSGIVSDQSSHIEQPKVHQDFHYLNTTSKSRGAIFSTDVNIDKALTRISNHHKNSSNIPSTVENKFIPSLFKNANSNQVDFGPIHPYMNAKPFYYQQYSDAYNTVASTSNDDSQSILSELFIPMNKTARKVKNRTNRIAGTTTNKQCPFEHEERCRWDRLPSKLLIRIFKYLSIHDICQSSQVCLNWYAIAWQPVLWDVIDFGQYCQEHEATDVNRTIRSVFSLLGGIQNPKCHLVHTIRLEKCFSLTDESVIAMSNSCPNLKSLNVRKCHLISNIAIFHILSKCRMLEKLNIEGCKLISSINTLPESDSVENRVFSLSELNLSNCPLIDDASLSILTFKFRGLKKLLVRNCKRITPVGLQFVARYCSQLQELSLNNLQLLSDEAIKNISLKINANLQYLSLANCIIITDISLGHLSDNCQHLRYLNLHKCRLVTDSGIMSLAISIHSSLISLSLSYCEKITNKSLSVISRYCSNIQQLDLNHCFKITDSGLQESCQHFRKLNVINIDNTSASVIAFDFLSQRYPNCCIIHNFITDC